MSIRYNRAVNKPGGSGASYPASYAGLVSRLGWKTVLLRQAASLIAVAVVTFFFSRLPVNPTTVALTFLLLVLIIASRWGLTIATTTAIVATLAFNYYFLPPIHTFTIADPQNWIALLAFLASAIIASRLSERARREAMNATQRRKEVERLYALSQQLLATDNVMELLNSIPGYVRDTFRLTAAAMYLPKRKEIYRTGVDHPELSAEQLESVSGRGELVVDAERRLCFVPLRVGIRPVGSLGLEGAVLSRETLEAVGSLIAISIERAGAVETLTRAEAAREGEKLRSALLDSVTHEFRTPLTSIKLSVTALMSSHMPVEATSELLTVINEETDRLNRLVGEAAEMAQLDAQQVELRREPLPVRPGGGRRTEEIGADAERPRAEAATAGGPAAHQCRCGADWRSADSVAGKCRQVFAGGHHHHHCRRIERQDGDAERLRPRSGDRRYGTVADLREVLSRTRPALPGARDGDGPGHCQSDCRGARRDDWPDFAVGQRQRVLLHRTGGERAGR